MTLDETSRVVVMLDGGGVGANVLVGGGNDSVTLQPVSITGQEGLNIAAGIGATTGFTEPGVFQASALAEDGTLAIRDVPAVEIAPGQARRPAQGADDQRPGPGFVRRHHRRP